MLLARWLRLVSKNCYRLFQRLRFLSAPSSPATFLKTLFLLLPKLRGPTRLFPNPPKLFFDIIWGGLEYVGHSFAYVAILYI
jgi:hypothetical protein